MSDTHFVARTAPDQPHLNTLVLRKPATVVVWLDTPDGKNDVPHSYRLVSDDGLYDKTLQRGAAVRQDEKRHALFFTEVIPGKTYSLYHCPLPDMQLPMFLNVPFASLEDHGDTTPEPNGVAPDKPALEPEPQLTSDDPLLHHDPADHAVDFAWYEPAPAASDEATA